MKGTHAMHTEYILILTAVTAAVTALLRFCPFVIFGRGKQTPEYISFLGEVLPGAIIGMLVIYCLKDTSFQSAGTWLPALIAVMSIIILHVWRRSSLLSISGGTAVYIILVNYVFI